MDEEGADLDIARGGEDAKRARREALEVLVQARDRLLRQMAGEILADREVILDGGAEGLFGFELQEIEDRYSARLNSLNSLLENLEYRNSYVEHRVETVVTTPRSLKRDLNGILENYAEWDVVGFNVVPVSGDQLLAVVALSSDVYPED